MLLLHCMRSVLQSRKKSRVRPGLLHLLVKFVGRLVRRFHILVEALPLHCRSINRSPEAAPPPGQGKHGILFVEEAVHPGDHQVSSRSLPLVVAVVPVLLPHTVVPPDNFQIHPSSDVKQLRRGGAVEHHGGGCSGGQEGPLVVLVGLLREVRSSSLVERIQASQLHHPGLGGGSHRPRSPPRHRVLAQLRYKPRAGSGVDQVEPLRLGSRLAVISDGTGGEPRFQSTEPPGPGTVVWIREQNLQLCGVLQQRLLPPTRA
mmetsp:Transcript_8180/g.20204  ORF Transcript_8180/g.20204 Transcript_8180/m.20204 type:complete len:260 (+) Transcript_8180:1357-2136(+)